MISAMNSVHHDQYHDICSPWSVSVSVAALCHVHPMTWPLSPCSVCKKQKICPSCDLMLVVISQGIGRWWTRASETASPSALEPHELSGSFPSPVCSSFALLPSLIHHFHCLSAFLALSPVLFHMPLQPALSPKVRMWLSVDWLNWTVTYIAMSPLLYLLTGSTITCWLAQLSPVDWLNYHLLTGSTITCWLAQLSHMQQSHHYCTCWPAQLSPVDWLNWTVTYAAVSPLLYPLTSSTITCWLAQLSPVDWLNYHLLTGWTITCWLAEPSPVDWLNYHICRNLTNMVPVDWLNNHLLTGWTITCWPAELSPVDRLNYHLLTGSAITCWLAQLSHMQKSHQYGTCWLAEPSPVDWLNYHICRNLTNMVPVDWLNYHTCRNLTNMVNPETWLGV